MSMSKNPIPKINNEFGKFIKSRRLELKLTQTEVAIKTNSALMTVFSIEKGIRSLLDIEILKKLSQVLKVSYPTLAQLIVEDMNKNMKEYFNIA